MNPFFYSEQSLSDLAHSVLKKAEKRGFAVAVDVSESLGLSVNVRRNEMESVQHNHDKAINITAYIAGRGEPGYHSGNATTNDFSPASIDRTLEAAWQIASATQCDPHAGLPEATSLYRGGQPFGDLECFKPWEIDVDSAVALGREIEGSAFATDPRITNSEGAGVHSGASQSLLAHSQGFSGYFQSSSHSVSMVAIAQDDRDMQVDYWYSEGIDASRFPAPRPLGRYAAERALARLYAKPINTQTCPVLFEAPLAIGLLGALVKALSGGLLYRRESFLLNSLGQQIFPKEFLVIEDPFIKGANGSGYFDNEGVATQVRKVIDQGVVEGYFLGSYAARRLGMKTTGNAGGAHNLRAFTAQHGGDFPAMLKKMGRGLLVTELMGQGVNYVTGDYSRGASGYWVEGGEIRHAVSGITIAGNLRDMWRDLVAVGSDEITRGNKTSGSMLIEKMRLASN